MTQLLQHCPFCGVDGVRFHGDASEDECDGCHHVYCPNCRVMVDFSESVDPNNALEELADLRERIVPRWNQRYVKLSDLPTSDNSAQGKSAKGNE